MMRYLVTCFYTRVFPSYSSVAAASRTNLTIKKSKYSIKYHRILLNSLAQLSSTSKVFVAASGICLRKMGDTQSGLPDTKVVDRPGKIRLSDEEWKAKLTTKEYRVTRKQGTEAAFTGELLENKDKGLYVCTCCGTELFSSSTKFDSGSGWPSFYDTLKDKDVADLPAVDTHSDESHGMLRTEVTCGKCDAHLGHVFNDGPDPTGLRYCINSVCLKFKPADEKKSQQKS